MHPASPFSEFFSAGAGIIIVITIFGTVTCIIISSPAVIDAFIESLDRGYTDISGEDVLKSMKAVFAALESAEKGKEERV